MSEYSNYSIKQTFDILSNNNALYGIQGYQIDKKYLDPRRIVEQKKNLEKSMKQPKAQSQKQVRHKSSYFQEITKEAASIPSPFSYQINQCDIGSIHSSKGIPIKSHSDRKTIFQELQKQLLKNNYPSPANYNINPENSKEKKGSSIKKAQIPSCIDESLRNSIEIPSIGQYNANDERIKWLKRVVEWKPPTKPKIKKPTVILPGVGAYSPKAVNYNLFENSIETNNLKNRHIGNFDRQIRWKSTLPQNNSSELSHNIISEWGIKVNNKKKDILQKVSRPTNHRSIYY